MTEKEAYIEIAQRYISSCCQHINMGINIQEAIGFKSYHAFESIGGAVNCHLGFSVPWTHEKKINAFVANYKNSQFARVNPKTIATLAIFLNSMRNKYLYPESKPTGPVVPKDQITLSQAKKLTSQINGVINHLVAAM